MGVAVIFRSHRPDWVRVYERAGGAARLLKSLRPVGQGPDIVEFLDVAENRDAQSERVYLFRRSGA
jgi:hypothetical protein